MSDEVAERIATFGGVPRGTAEAIAYGRDGGEYPLGRASVEDHLDALDAVYASCIAAHREAIEAVRDSDPITEDILIGQTRKLELYQWFVRAHLERSSPHALRFGSADRAPTDAEAASAEGHRVSERTAEAYREMAQLGANAKGEGRIG
jgi:starvation-inducible DNA-binding protein